jgi:hypothetical protein
MRELADWIVQWNVLQNFSLSCECCDIWLKWPTNCADDNRYGDKVDFTVYIVCLQ